MMRLLLALGADINGFECHAAGCRTPLIAAAEGGQFKAMQLLLVSGAEVNKNLKLGQMALMFASFHGDAELVSLLLSSGAEVNADCERDTVLIFARKRPHENRNLLIAAGATR
jgi:uncharacterized protein